MMSSLDTLETLAADELALVALISVDGFGEEKMALAESLALGPKWSAIVDRYAALLLAAEAGTPFSAVDPVELLKRAVSVVWYQCADPPFLTGMVTPFRAESLTTICRALARAVASGELDAEFRLMLSWYMLIAPEAFTQVPAGSALPMRVTAWQPTQGQQFPCRTAAAWRQAGLMGWYWWSKPGATTAEPNDAPAP